MYYCFADINIRLRVVVMKVPSLKLLNIFITVVRCQGFAPAQQELNLSTSAISNYMTQLETELGMLLCHRGRGGFKLTSKGALFYQKTLQLLGEVDSFGNYLSTLKGELIGSLRIGLLDAMVTNEQFPLPNIIAAFNADYVNVHISLEIHRPYEMQTAILEGRLDLGIGSFPNKMNGLWVQPLYDEQQRLYCSDLHPLFSEKNVTKETIANQKMANRSYWSDAELARQGFKNSSATIDSMESQLILILSGAYLGYLPEHYARVWVDNNRLRMLDADSYGYKAPFSLIVKRSGLHEPVIRAFRKSLVEHYGGNLTV